MHERTASREAGALHDRSAGSQAASWRTVLSLTSLASVLLALSVAAPAATAGGGFHKCPGKVMLRFGDQALHIKAKRLTCRKAKRIIKAPATKRGYKCAEIGRSGGLPVIGCKKGRHVIRFVYVQS